MICRNGGQLAANCLNGRRKEMIAARGFFEVFWRWSRVGCQATRRDSYRSLHTTLSRKSVRRVFTAPGKPKPRIEPLPPLQTSEPPAEPEIEPAPAKPPISESLRLLMRSLPHSVVVVTASKIRLEGALLDSPIHIKSAKPTTPRDYRGMTVSSFTTLTLTPEPIISFNVKFPSQTLAAIEHSRHFLIHILEASENGMKIAREFTKGSRHVEKIFFGSTKGFGIKPISVKTRFEGKDMCLPMLRERGVMGVLRCEVLGNIGGGKSGLVKVGDHMLVLAKVEEILDGGGKEGEQERVKGGLCYADGRYRRVGDVIKGERDIIEVKEDPIEGKKDWVEVVIDMKKDGEE